MCYRAIKFNPKQRRRFQQALVEIWKANNQTLIQDALDDLKYFGKGAAAVLLEAYDAADPERRNFMQNRGAGNLVGQWKWQDALLANRVPYTDRYTGASFTDSLTLDIFQDGLFNQIWSHSHCSNDNVCCRQCGAKVSGEVSDEGPKLILKVNSGTMFNKDACIRSNDPFRSIQPETENLRWSIQQTAGQGVTLCANPPRPVCYVRQR